MAGTSERIVDAAVTPVAFRDLPQLNSVRVHEPYAHWPWKRADEDVVDPAPLRSRDGAVAVPTATVPGVKLDRDALARLHRQYLDCGLRDRDDTGYMRRFDPSFSLKNFQVVTSSCASCSITAF
ncbi:hypothetical protein ACFWWT_20230 [Streptomyces sp. NPDC058676]|uniref:hypothetical protein n=1 Tax=unclassified Streptomyces TaxID=2593676 RepID=UPI0036640D02